MSYTITVHIHCDYTDCAEVFSGPGSTKVRKQLRENHGWATTKDDDGKKQDYCPKHWRMILEEAEREGYTLHDGEWIETTGLKRYGWRGLIDGGSSEGLAK